MNCFHLKIDKIGGIVANAVLVCGGLQTSVNIKPTLSFNCSLICTVDHSMRAVMSNARFLLNNGNILLVKHK